MAEHTLSLVVDNKPGVLTRVTGLITRRGYNIESLAVDKTENPKLSRVTRVTMAEDVSIEQIKKQLHKLINVHKIVELSPEDSVDRELVLFRVSTSTEQRPELIKLSEMFKVQIIDVAANTLTIEATEHTTASHVSKRCWCPMAPLRLREVASWPCLMINGRAE